MKIKIPKTKLNEAERRGVRLGTLLKDAVEIEG